jgi:tetratricopeptide (TPR) repeat protein
VTAITVTRCDWRVSTDVRYPLVRTLGSLVDSSLIRPVTRDGEPRFGLLEIVRGYGLERLRDARDRKQAHDRHAAYFMALAAPAESELPGPRAAGVAGSAGSGARRPTGRVVLAGGHRSARAGSAPGLGDLAVLVLHGHATELVGLEEEIAAGSGRLPPLQRAMALALTGTGFTFAANGDLARAQALFEQSVSLYGQVKDKLGADLTAIVLGRLAGLRGDYAAASQLLENSQAALQEVGDGELAGYERLQHQLTAALVGNFSGQIQLSLGDYDRAAQLFTDGLSVARRAQNRIPILISLYDLALSRQGQGDLPGAAEHLKEGLSLAAEAGDQTSSAYYLEGLAAVARRQDDPQRAVRLLAAARALLEASGSGWLTPTCPASCTTIQSWPRCAPRWAAPPLSRPGPGADPSAAGAPRSSRSSRETLLKPVTRPAGAKRPHVHRSRRPPAPRRVCLRAVPWPVMRIGTGQ